ncbi:MAG: multidrug efflux RND transporter permease subunit [Candidatus Sumerlaeia bacterium]|nr:multidrug efflux RND transporter permease subunit [Candidatus Sumerlaeia bacterium]
MFSDFFIRRPIFATVFSILILVMGIVGFLRLPVDRYPDITPPVVRVTTNFPGADARVLAQTVAAPIEQEVNGVDDMLYLSSTCASNGTYQLDITFEQGTDVDLAAILVQNRVSIAEPRLPEEVRRQGIVTRKQSSNLVQVVSLLSPDGSRDDLFLANFMALNIKDELTRIPGVGGTTLLPEKDYSMRIWLDPLRLKARGLTVLEVRDAIQEQNIQVAAGQLGLPPAPEDLSFQFTVRTKGRLSEPAEFEQIIVRDFPDGRVVRLGDVAKVELGAQSYSTKNYVSNTAGVSLLLYQLPGSNALEMAKSVEAAMEELSRNFPPGVEYRLMYDSTVFIEESVKSVYKTLVEAFLLVFLVVLVFLQNWRATLIPTLVIPVALVGTFVLMAALGFSVNMLTLFGLVLAIGIVVDDAIIVVENVERLMAEGLSPLEATFKAMREISGAILAISLVLMAVFLPTAALSGLTGELYRQFALTIAASTFFSAVCALTLSPALSAVFLRPHVEHKKEWLATRLFNNAFEALSRYYAAFVRLSINLWFISLPLFLSSIALTYYLVTTVPQGFLPPEDQGVIMVDVTLPDNAALGRTDELMLSLSEEIIEIEGVDRLVTQVGTSFISGFGSNYGSIVVVLKPWKEREKKHRSAFVILNEIRPLFGKYPEGFGFAFNLPSIPGLGATAGFDMRLQDRAGLGTEVLSASVQNVLAEARKDPRISQIFSSYRPGVAQYYVDIDRERVKKLNIPLSSVFATLQTALGSAYINDLTLFSRVYRVYVQADTPFRIEPADIGRLEVRNADGDMVPVSTFARVVESFGPSKVERYNLYESATITGAAAPGISSGESIALMEEVADRVLPQGIGYEWTSMAYQEKRVGNQGVYVFILGIFVVFLILAAQYESWLAPVSVILSIPLAVLGAMVGLIFRGMDNNIYTQVGLVLLIALAAKNAILIVEFAREQKAHGKTTLEAAVEASRLRFRPILMTSFAFILGVVPLIEAEGAGAAARQALGTAVFSGMVGATLFGLLFIPVLYAVVDWTGDALLKRSSR